MVKDKVAAMPEAPAAPELYDLSEQSVALVIPVAGMRVFLAGSGRDLAREWLDANYVQLARCLGAAVTRLCSESDPEKAMAVLAHEMRAVAVAGYIEPLKDEHYEFVDMIKGGAIPAEFIPSCDKGFRAAMEKGTLIGFPVTNVRVVINDGQSHPVDSSDIAFQLAAIGAFREAYEKAKPAILEPIKIGRAHV